MDRVSIVRTGGGLALVGAIGISAPATSAASFKFTSLAYKTYSTIATGIDDKDDVVGYVVFVYGGSDDEGVVWRKGDPTLMPNVIQFGLISEKGIAVAAPSQCSCDDELYNVLAGVSQQYTIEKKDLFFLGVSGINVRHSLAASLTFYGHTGQDKPAIVTGDKYKLLYPFGSKDAAVGGINDGGTVVSFYPDANNYSIYHGFSYTSGNYATLDPPGSVDTRPRFVTDGGVIGGFYSTSTESFGWTFSGGLYTSYSFPGSTSTTVIAVTSSGTVIGQFYIGSVSHGFVYANGSYYQIDYPRATSTFITGVNSRGSLIGSYQAPGNPYPEAFVANCASPLCTK
jgi:hypothetical protein